MVYPRVYTTAELSPRMPEYALRALLPPPSEIESDMSSGDRRGITTRTCSNVDTTSPTRLHAARSDYCHDPVGACVRDGSTQALSRTAPAHHSDCGGSIRYRPFTCPGYRSPVWSRRAAACKPSADAFLGRRRHQCQRYWAARHHLVHAHPRSAEPRNVQQPQSPLLRCPRPAAGAGSVRVRGRHCDFHHQREGRHGDLRSPGKGPAMSPSISNPRTGFSLVEVLVAMMLLAFVMMSLGAASSLSLSQMAKARQDLQYSADVQQVTDSLVARGWNKVTDGSATIRGRAVTWTVATLNPKSQLVTVVAKRRGQANPNYMYSDTVSLYLADIKVQ